MAGAPGVHVSIVIPVYHGSECIDELHKRLVDALTPISDRFEVVMVNDASPDDSWEKIVRLSKRDPRVRGINLSRNFGQHCAILAGIDAADGDWVVVMDCDLQDRPEEIAALYDKTKEGHDVVFARRAGRQDSFVKRLTSRAFSAVYNALSDIKLDNSVSNFSIVSRQVAESFRRLRERNRSYPLFIHWLGFDRAYVDVDHAARFAGKSSYNLARSINFAIESITSQSNRPIRLSIGFGFAMSVGSFVFILYLLIRYFIYGIAVAGWTSVIVSFLFVSGLMFANLGVLGLYLGNVFNETKGRPLYVVKSLTHSEQHTGGPIAPT